MTPTFDGQERRRASINGLPGWAQIVSVLGFPIVVAMILLGVFVGYVPSPLLAGVSDLQSQMRSHTSAEWERVRMLRVLCRHQAIAFKQNADDCDMDGRGR